MQNIHIDKILIPDQRQRREFLGEDIQKLAVSILSKGLLHPIVVRQEADGFFSLVAGERRLRAIKSLYAFGDAFKCDGNTVPMHHIPTNRLQDLSELEYIEAELEENVVRKDLTWQEKAAAEGKLHSLRTKQAELRGEVQTSAQTSEEIRGPNAHAQTRRNLILSENLARPEIVGAKTEKEAYKILKAVAARENSAAVALAVGKTYSADNCQLLNEDSLVWMASAAESQFDIILTDPPYGMGADSFGDGGGNQANVNHRYEDSPKVLLDLITVLAPESFRLARPAAHLYCFCDIDGFHMLRKEFAAAGWRVHRTPLIWNKETAFRVPWPQMGPRRTYELILYAVKGNKPVNYIGNDIITARLDEQLGHSAQKPVSLLTELLLRSGLPGDKVFDPFMGTGATVAAAFKMKMSVTGIELEDASYGIAVKRLETLSAPAEENFPF